MKIAAAIARIFLGLIFVVFGSNAFLHFIPMPPPPNSEAGFTAAIRIVPAALAVAFVLGVLATVVAALLPARRLARVPVVEALRRAV